MDTLQRERVLLTGTIRGGGYMAATCHVSATKVTLVGTTSSGYLDYIVESVSPRLPEGDYFVTILGRTLPIAQRRGRWVAP